MRRIEVLLLAALSMTVINDAAAQSAPPRTKTVPDFVDHRRLPGSGAAEDTAPSSVQLDKAAAASAEEEKKRLATEVEAEAKRKADDEKRLAAEAEAKRKADDEKRLAAEAEAKRKADDEKRLAAEAEAKRKADDEKRGEAFGC
ncbi:MAG: hypothetical protein HOP09_01140 [Hyphomicrobium sp.]|nr:hypothetical protein [Hyphomicrobium sp.]